MGSHNTFGGVFYESDFNTEYCNGSTAQRIATTMKFDETCMRNLYGRKDKRGINHEI